MNKKLRIKQTVDKHKSGQHECASQHNNSKV